MLELLKNLMGKNDYISDPMALNLITKNRQA